MDHKIIKAKITKHLDNLNETDKQQDLDTLTNTIAKRYDIPRDIVKKSLAEWSAGRKNT